MRDLTWRAHERESTTAYTMQESIDLMRIGPQEVARYGDGLTLEGPVIGLGKLFGAVSREALEDPNSAAFKQGLDMFRARAASARAFAWLTNDGATREGQVAAGRAYMRLTLEAAAQGLAVHPWSQALQPLHQQQILHQRQRWDAAAPLQQGAGHQQSLIAIGQLP